MKEKVIEALRDLGFLLEEAEGLGYYFSYEGVNLIYMDNCGDEDFLNIAAPGIYDSSDGDETLLRMLSEKVNSTLKYVKAYMFGERVWFFYERELFEGDDLPRIISRMILHMESAVVYARKALKEVTDAAGGGQTDGADDGMAETGGDNGDNGDGNG